MKLTSNNDSLAENKVLILYILDNLNKPITSDNLLKLVLYVQEMNYFYFQQFLLDLLENKFIIGYTKDEETMYKITDKGRQTLELTNDLLPGILKLKIDTALKVRVDEVQNEVHPTSDFTPINEDNFTVKCNLVENNMTIFGIKLTASSREQAKLISQKWENNYNEIYAIVMELLTKKD